MEQLRELMHREGAWNYAMNLRVYTAQEFIEENGEHLSETLKELINQRVGRLQLYCDYRILEPIG